MNFTQMQQEELEKIGELFRQTIYDESLNTLPRIVNAFGHGLKLIPGDISGNIASEIFRFHKLISSDYTSVMRKRIDNLKKLLSASIPKDISFRIICRQKSWESSLRKILKYYFEGTSLNLTDVIALRIIIDAPNYMEENLNEMCYKITHLCIDFFTKNMCVLMPPSRLVADNPLYKDYIAHPKSNGYRSIHLGFMDIENNIFEVQVRTLGMDADAEFGPENALEPDSESGSLEHSVYKDSEYKHIIPYISFDPTKVNKPFFRSFLRVVLNDAGIYEKKLIVVDHIGLRYAKPIGERSRTF